MSESNERIIRIERDLHHVSEQVSNIDGRQTEHEFETRTSFSVLKENAVRQQIATENLVKAVEQVAHASNTRLAQVERRQDEQDDRLAQVERKWDFSLLLGKGVITIITTPALLFIVWSVISLIQRR